MFIAPVYCQFGDSYVVLLGPGFGASCGPAATKPSRWCAASWAAAVALGEPVDPAERCGDGVVPEVWEVLCARVAEADGRLDGWPGALTDRVGEALVVTRPAGVDGAVRGRPKAPPRALASTGAAPGFWCEVLPELPHTFAPCAPRGNSNDRTVRHTTVALLGTTRFPLTDSRPPR